MLSMLRSQMVRKLLTSVVGAGVALMALAFVVILPIEAQQFAGILPRPGQPPSCDNLACSCQSNLKQISLSVQEYVADYDERFPNGTQQAPDHAPYSFSGVGWAGQVYPYQNNAPVFKCPADNTQAPHGDSVVSYGLNSNIAGLPIAYFRETGLTVSLFEVTGDYALLTNCDEGAGSGATIFSAAGDGTDGHLLAGIDAQVVPGVQYATGVMAFRPTASPSQFSVTGPRHGEGTNFVFLDGHVMWFRPGQESTGTVAANSDAAQTGTVTGMAAGYDNDAFQNTFSYD